MNTIRILTIIIAVAQNLFAHSQALVPDTTTAADLDLVIGQRMNYETDDVKKDFWQTTPETMTATAVRDTVTHTITQKELFNLTTYGYKGFVSIKINYQLGPNNAFKVNTIDIDGAPYGKKYDFTVDMSANGKASIAYSPDQKQIIVPLVVTPRNNQTEARTLRFAIKTNRTDEYLNRMAHYAHNIMTYNQQYTQERVYLHTDNNGYLPGETLWFKAYVFNGSSLLPTDMSKVLYVELLNPHGQVMDRRTLPVTNGRTYGDIKIDPLLYQPGYYELRAYTRAMLNWNQAYIFSRILPVYEIPRDSVSFKDISLGNLIFERDRTGITRARPTPLTDSTTIRVRNHMLTFYPEGGNIVLGTPSTVAYKLTDKDGLPLYDTIKICRTDGQTLTFTRPVNEGMGKFELPPDWTGGYALIGKHRFDLPKPSADGCAMTVTHTADRGINIHLSPSRSMASRLLGMSITSRGQLIFFSDITPLHRDSIHIPYTRLRDGINQITLFTPEGEILSERLVWCAPHHQQPSMVIKQNKPVYDPFSPIVLDINLQDADGQALRGDFSLAVRDADTETGQDPHSMQVEMLLASELRGFISHPEQYFAEDDTLAAHNLDLLLMVQGWRRYEWQQMAGIKPFELKQPAEDGLLLFGNVRQTSATDKNLASDGELSLNFIMQTHKGTRIFSTPTDKDGKFALKLKDFYDGAPTIISVTNKEDKRVYTDLKINRNFSPRPLPYEPLALATRVGVGHSRAQAKGRVANTFEWNDTIPDHITGITHLRGVTVKGRNPDYGYRPGQRYKWNGTEDAIKPYATYYYNIREELDKYLDEGKGVPNIWEWLAEINPHFEYFPGTEEKLYNGRRVSYSIDNDKKTQGRLPAIEDPMMNEYRSLMIVEDNDAASNIAKYTDGTIVHVTNHGATIYLFTRDDIVKPPYYERGTRWLVLHGYSRCNKFYSPDYRQYERPTATDHRRTLYWNPSLTTDAHGKASVTFYSNARQDQHIVINAQGIATNGQMFEGK